MSKAQPEPRWRRRALALLVLLAAPFFLRLWPVDHGLPRGYVPDTHAVRCALGMARDRDPIPPAGRYSTYPYLMPYMLLPVYAAQYAGGRAAGRWAGAEEFGMRAMQDPGLVQLPARILVAVLGALTAWAVFRGARAAGLSGGAWVAAWMAATGLLHVQFSTHERPWVPMLFFGALSLWAAALHARDGRTRHLVLAGLAAGLSFACHQAGLVMLGACGLAWLLGPTGWRGRALGGRIKVGVACVALFALVALVVGYPYYLRHGGVAPEAVIGGEQAAGKFQVGGQSIRFEVSLASLSKLSRALVGYDPALVVLGLLGLIPALSRRGTRFAALFLLAYAAFFMTNVNPHVRYLLPLTVLLAWPAGLGAQQLSRTRPGLAVLGLLLVLPLIQSLRLGQVLNRPDSRVEGEEQLAALPEGSLVAVDHYGPVVDLSLASLERLATYRELRVRERNRLELLRGGHLPEEMLGLDVLPVEDVLEFDPETNEYGVRAALRHLGATPGELFASQGATHLMLVDRRPGDGEPPRLAHLVEGAAPIAIVNPSRDPRRPTREALLPTDMDFPLAGLWTVDRPGPRMELYELRR